MDLTIFWVVILFGMMVVLWFGYKAWRRNNSRAVSRRPRNRSSANEWRHGNFQQGDPADAITQLGHLNEKGNARTVSRRSQNQYIEEDQTAIRQNQKLNPLDRQHQQPGDSADVPTQIGNNRIDNVEPEDDRTIL